MTDTITQAWETEIEATERATRERDEAIENAQREAVRNHNRLLDGIDEVYECLAQLGKNPLLEIRDKDKLSRALHAVEDLEVDEQYIQYQHDAKWYGYCVRCQARREASGERAHVDIREWCETIHDCVK